MELIAERGKSIEDTTEARVAHATDTRTAARSKKRLWAGRIMSGLAILFLAFDGVVKVLELPPVVEGTTRLGYPASVVFGLGIVQLVCLIAYVIPRTSVLGAVLLTGYLGGAIATHVRIGDPLFTHTLFPIYVAVLVWGALYLRDGWLRAVIPLRARD